MRTKEENIKELKRRMRQALSDKHSIGDRIFAENRFPTEEEVAEMDVLQARHDNYAMILRIYFPPNPDAKYWNRLKKQRRLH